MSQNVMTSNVLKLGDVDCKKRVLLVLSSGTGAATVARAKPKLYVALH